METKYSQMEMEQMLLFPEELTCSLEAPHAKGLVLPEQEKDLKMTEATYVSHIYTFLNKCNPNGLFGKMYQVSLQPTKEMTSKSSSNKLMKSGIAVHGECWMLNMCEHNNSLAPSLKEEGVCSLSDILEMNGKHLQKYYLSQKACSGILHRAERREKVLPEILKKALEQQAKM